MGFIDDLLGTGDAPEAPDYSALSDATLKAAEMANAQATRRQDFTEKQWDEFAPLLRDTLDTQSSIMGEQHDWARESRDRYKGTFEPLQDNFIDEAQAYDSPERRKREAARAMAGVQHSLDAQRENAQANLESYGIDPSQTRSMAMDSDARLKGAAMQAGAANTAENRVEDVGRAMRSDAINMGNGLPMMAANAYGGAVGAGNSAVGNVNNTMGMRANTLGTGQSWHNAGQSGMANTANIMNAQYANQLSEWGGGGGMMSALGGIGGTAAGIGLGKWMGAQEGGEVPNEISAIPGPEDRHPVMLADGEYVVPASVVKAKGTDFFDKLKEKYEGAEGNAPAQGNAPAPAPAPDAAGVRHMSQGGYIQDMEPQEELAEYSRRMAMQRQQEEQQRQQQQQQQGDSTMTGYNMYNQFAGPSAGAPVAGQAVGGTPGVSTVYAAGAEPAAVTSTNLMPAAAPAAAPAATTPAATTPIAVESGALGAGSGNSSMLAAAGPWAALAAAVVINEDQANSAGRRDDDRTSRGVDMFSGAVLEQDADYYGDKVGGVGGKAIKVAGQAGHPEGIWNGVKSGGKELERVWDNLKDIF